MHGYVVFNCRDRFKAYFGRNLLYDKCKVDMLDVLVTVQLLPLRDIPGYEYTRSTWFEHGVDLTHDWQHGGAELVDIRSLKVRYVTQVLPVVAQEPQPDPVVLQVRLSREVGRWAWPSLTSWIFSSRCLIRPLMS